MELHVGDKAPELRAKTLSGKNISLSDFGDKTIILYFYPKDMTKGCSIQAEDYSSLIEEFTSLNCVIIGISPDSITSHQNFIEKKNLKIELLSDKDNIDAKAYGAYGVKKLYGKEYIGIKRSSFIIKNGVIVEAFYNVKATGNAKRMLDFLKSKQ